MTDDRDARIDGDNDLDALLDAALGRPAAERLPFVRRQAAGRPALRDAAERVLREADEGDPFLDPDGLGAVALRGAALGAEEPHALAPGDTFAAYDVVELVGRGGMGEVYRAVDRRLGRQVALKVLPRAFSDDPHRLARFEREARVLASLNHPNIGAIYGLADETGRPALVLEFVEGASLATLLEHGPLPIAQALAIARQAALALDAAHQGGVVHRDLKPANIVVTPEGTVKVLDFGLAKAASGAAPDAGLTGVLAPGTVLGTPSYMAPEQAEGRPVDHRADTWAFGCILFEMLTGTRAFDGGNPEQALARILEGAPDFQLLPPATPEAVRRLLRRTLARDPGARPARVGEAVLAIDAVTRGAATRRRAAVATGVAASILLLAGALAGLSGAWPWRPAPPAAVRSAVPIPASEQLLPSAQQVAAISPDGRTLVYRAIREGQASLFVRTLGELTSRPLTGAGHASGPFFSPDGTWIAFDGDGVLQKVPLAGGTPVTLSYAPGGASASWGGDTIVFSTSTARGLHRVPAGGGPARPLTTVDREAGEAAHAFPHVLPRGDAALFTIVRDTGPEVATVRFDTGAVQSLLPGSQPRYLRPGYVIFARGASLWAAPFDERRLAVTGAAVRVLDEVDTAGAAVQYAVSNTGTLIYAPRREAAPERTIAWLDLDGRESLAPLAPARYTRVALSPDGTRLALAASEGGRADIWIADLAGGSPRRLTADSTVNAAPLWSPDGRTIVVRSDREGGGLFLLAADGTGAAERLTSAQDALHTPHGFAPDGRTVLFTEFRSYTDQAILAVDLTRPLRPRPLVAAPGAQARPQVSPDGRWLAYQSDESGRFEIYLRPYPDVEAGVWPVTTGGGTSPRWSADGGQLFFHDGRGLSAAAFAGGPAGQAPAFAAPRHLHAWAPFGGRLGPDYDVTPDGTRVLFIRHADDTPASRLRLLVVEHWTTELARLVTRQ
jgi:eukaryotic-like serine/threonine-protein kinase